LRGKLDQVHDAGAELLFIGNGSAEQAAAFQREQAPDSPVYTDPSRSAYQALGMIRSVGATLGLGSMLAGIKAMRRGFRQRSTQGDPWQQGGLFAVARGGQVVYSQPYTDAGGRPDLEAALRALRETRSASKT
jgi:hypothetical protein